jgi:hypothetical protein
MAAEMLGMLVYDRDLRERVLDGQRKRLQDFSPAALESRLRETLTALQPG